MKGSLFWKFAYLCCALTGILAGYGVFSLAGMTEHKENISTKDNTLVRESGDSVFFSGNSLISEPTVTPVATPVPTVTPVPTSAVTPTPAPTPIETPVPTEGAAPSVMPESIEILPEAPEITSVPEETVSAQTELLPSLASHWVGMGIAEVPRQELSEAEQKEVEVKAAFTYPVKIFGQTPVINRSDTYVSYFEFCYDLIAMVEPKVQARGLNLNALMTKFALKALFCGIDIEQLDINAPIPRRLAALCLWLAAQVLNESGCDTSSRSAERYVTDIASCSVSERRAIAYLYEQGVVAGYQKEGQRFCPQDGLKTEVGETWITGIKQCWK